MIIAGKTDIGQIRAENQDTWRAGRRADGTGWALVCDGMGGARAGGLASRTAAGSMEQQLWEAAPREAENGGVVLAEAVSIVLAQRLGRDHAHHLLEQCCQRAVAEQRHLRTVLGEEPQVSAELSAEELDRLLDPAHYLGQARVWVARAVSEHQRFTA